MKVKISEKIAIPNGINCTIENKILTCKKGDKTIVREVNLPKVDVSVKGNDIIFSSQSSSKESSS